MKKNNYCINYNRFVSLIDRDQERKEEKKMK